MAACVIRPAVASCPFQAIVPHIMLQSAICNPEAHLTCQKSRETKGYSGSVSQEDTETALDWREDITRIAADGFGLAL